MISEYDIETTGPAVYVVEDEYDALADLVCSSPRATPGIALLWHELERARRLNSGEAPPDLVRVGARLVFTDLSRRESKLARLVYPRDADRPNRIAVTSSLGAALLGLHVGEVFQWKTASGETRAVRVDAIEREVA